MNTPSNSFGCAICIVIAPFHQVQMRPKWIFTVTQKECLLVVSTGGDREESECHREINSSPQDTWLLAPTS
jgi:hypothetical protein